TAGETSSFVRRRGAAGLRFVTAHGMSSEGTASEQEPWERAEAFRSFVDRNDDLMLVVGPTTHVVYVNEAGERVFGVAREECLGRSLLDFVHAEDLERTRADFQRW